MLKALISYSTLAVPLAFVGIPIYINAPEFYAVTHKISLTEIGVALLALRLFDAIQDPIIGKLSDIYGDYRRLIIIIGLVFLLIGFWCLFNPITPSINWFAYSVLACTFGFSVVNINYLAYGGLWQVSDDDKSKVTSFREGFGLLGLILAAAAPSLISEDKSYAYHIVSIYFMPCIALALILLFYWQKHSKLIPKLSTKTSFELNSWNMRFFLIYLVNSFASSIPAVLVLFFIRDSLNAEVMSGYFLLTYFLAGALAMPIWHYLAKTIGKHKAWGLSMLLASISFVWAFNLNAGTQNYFFLVCAVSGAALGADLALPPAMIAHKIAKQNIANQASQYFAIINFITKLSLAIAAGSALPLLAKLGYQPGTSFQYLGYAYALIPSIIKLFAATMVFWRSNEI